MEFFRRLGFVLRNCRDFKGSYVIMQIFSANSPTPRPATPRAFPALNALEPAWTQVLTVKCLRTDGRYCRQNAAVS